MSEAAKPWLSLTGEEPHQQPTVGMLSRLRRDLWPERSHLVVEQVELRARGREKFSRADQMFFTRQGLEQATDEQLAAYKASRFVVGEAVVDLCCGIGGDLISLGRRGRRRVSIASRSSHCWRAPTQPLMASVRANALP